MSEPKSSGIGERAHAPLAAVTVRPTGAVTERPQAAESAATTERPVAHGPSSLPSAASDARLQAALSATSRADASLSTLMRAVRDLGTGVTSAREANVELVSELGSLADLLGAANERQLALKNRVTFLEQALAQAQKEAERERTYILDQQDAFIASMLEDHERVLAELHRELDAVRGRLSQRPTAMPQPPSLTAAPPAEVSSLRPAADKVPADVRSELEILRKDVEKLLADRERTRETLLKLQAQRDEAQAAVVLLTRERDQARSEGAQNRINEAVRQAIPPHILTPAPTGRMASTLPPPESPSPRSSSSNPPRGPGSTGKPSSRRRGADAAPPSVDPSTRTTAPMPFGAQRPRAPSLDLIPREQRSASPPPEELRAALHPPSTPVPPPPLLTPAPVTPRGPEAHLGASPELTNPPVPAAGQPRPKLDPSLRPATSYSMTNSVAPELVSPVRVSRPPRR